MTTTALQEQWGRRIRAARLRSGFTLGELARRTSIHKGQLSRVENGLMGIGDDGRIRIAAALGRRVEDLFPYPDTTDLENECRSAASAPGAASSPTPATTGATPSPAPSAKEPDGSDRAENPRNEGA